MTDRRDEAVVLLRRAHEAHLGGDLGGAVIGYRRALALVPQLVDAEHFLAILWFQRADFAKAAARFAALMGRGQRMPEVALNLGHARAGLGRGREAATAYRRAVAWSPADPAAWIGIGNQATGDFGMAAACFRRALISDPMDSLALGNYGSALAGLGSPAAGRWHRRSIVMTPNAAFGWINAGHDVRGAGDWRGAGSFYRRASALAPGDALALSESIHADLQMAAWSGLARRVSRLADKIDRGGTVPPFHLLALDVPAALKRANAERWCERYPIRRACPRPPSSTPLRLGYLSGDFRRHAVAYEIVDMIERHDRRRVSLHGYGWSPDDGSDIRARLDRAFGGIIDLGRLGDEAAAARIEADGIDVLIDLAGHTHGARPGIVARRPAPIQVSYFGFPGTTGAPYHDYALVDDVVAPVGDDAVFREALVRVPGCYWPHDSKRLPPAPVDRSVVGLPAEAVVLACFNQVYKIQPESFGLWMQILRQVPEAMLWLLDAGPVVAANLRREATAAGVAPDRLIFAPRRSVSDHLARLPAADIVVDTLPYNAHTTASDALTMGCPVVTRLGRDFAGRVCASMLVSIGFGDLVTKTPSEFVECVAALAAHADERARLKQRLADRVGQGPLFDTLRLSRSIESAVLEMRRRSSIGLAPSAFAAEAAE